MLGVRDDRSGVEMLFKPVDILSIASSSPPPQVRFFLQLKTTAHIARKTRQNITRPFTGPSPFALKGASLREPRRGEDGPGPDGRQ